MRTDRILPESIASVRETSQPNICLKILNFETGTSNFILRPGQILPIDELDDEKLKTVYCFMKALKAHYAIDVKSYFLKKVLLLEENVEMAKDPANDEVQLLYSFLRHPLLKKEFEMCIDYRAWGEKLNDNKNGIKTDVYYTVPNVKE